MPGNCYHTKKSIFEDIKLYIPTGNPFNVMRVKETTFISSVFSLPIVKNGSVFHPGAVSAISMWEPEAVVDE